MSQFLVF